MKRFSLILALGLTASVYAQNPENEIPDFNLDDFYVEPKFSLSVGTRLLSGASVGFGGSGAIPFSQNLVDPDATDVVRVYHDGVVQRDTRENAADGKTNTWGYYDSDQVVGDGAAVEMHLYSASVHNGTIGRRDTGSSLGTELVLSRDMGKIGNKFEWKLFAGIGINGISSSAQRNVNATITTVTDSYSLDGQTLPDTVPYAAPSFTVDNDGNVVDTTVLLGQKPDSRTSTAVTNDTQVLNAWRLKGTYLTARLGPTLIYHVADNFRLSLSAGPALVYSGTNYAVIQTLTPDISDPIVSVVGESNEEVLTGYYVDATLEYLITERAGFYAGAFYQTSGEYTSTITENGANYTTDIDLSRLQGFRAGLNFKF